MSADSAICQTLDIGQAAELLGRSEHSLYDLSTRGDWGGLRFLRAPSHSRPDARVGRVVVTKRSVYTVGGYEETLAAAAPLALGDPLPIAMVVEILGVGEHSTKALLNASSIALVKGHIHAKNYVGLADLEAILGGALRLWPAVPETRHSLPQPIKRVGYADLEARVAELEQRVAALEVSHHERG